MQIYRGVLVVAIIFALLLSGCSGSSQKSEPEKQEDSLQLFLESYSEQDIENLFSMISAVALPNIPDSTDPYPYYGFKDTSELSSNGLYNFFLVFSDTSEADLYWNESDRQYHIPLSFVHKTLDSYFAGYQFSPDEITYECGYLPAEQSFVTTGIVGHDVRKDGVKVTATKQTAQGDISIEAKTLELDDPAKETGGTEILVLHPTETSFVFASYEIIPAT